MAGIGEAVGHVKDLILKIIEYVLNSDQRRLENEERELKNQKLRLENIEIFIQILRDNGFTGSEVRELIPWFDKRQGTFLSLVESGKLKKVFSPERLAEPEEG